MQRWLWLSPILAVLLSVSVFFYWGWSWVSAGLIALIATGLAIMIWWTYQRRTKTCGCFESEQ